MNVDSSPVSVDRRRALLSIFVGGIVAGTLDLISAFLLFGLGVPRAIASGLLGVRALHSGPAVWILGVFLHFFIAFSAAAVYYLAGRKLEFLKSHFLVCGLFYGIAVFLVMNLIVVPLSAAPFRGHTFTVPGLIQGLLVHMFLIGLPVSFAAWKFRNEPGEIAPTDGPAGS
jgi:hypothetical protein